MVRTPTETRFWQQKSFPFGAISAVHAWSRVAEALMVIARRMFHIPLIRYVDDIRGVEIADSRLTYQIVCNIMDAITGLSRKFAKSHPPSDQMVDLGVLVTIQANQCLLEPPDEKRTKWRNLISQILLDDALSPTGSGELVGKLSRTTLAM